MPRSLPEKPLADPVAAPVPTCRSCLHFDDDPSRIEAEFPGILVFGSAYASARGHAGICTALDRFLDPLPASSCPSFAAIPGSSAERLERHAPREQR